MPKVGTILLLRQALDLCLACKGCKHDCPVNVDMATYKAEFRSHYYKNRLRPRAAYSMGLISVWAGHGRPCALASKFLRTESGFSRRWANGPAALLPRARFRLSRRNPMWLGGRRNPTRNPGGRPVVLFPDTFNNYFRPQTAIAATIVLEAAGWQVVVPRKPVCCARPLYDWGMLDTAKKWLRQLMDEVGGEASAAFRW